MNEKQELERAAMEKFIVAHNNEYGSPGLTLVRLGDSPDAVVRLGEREIGVEIAHAYGTDFDARNALGRAGNVKSIRVDKILSKQHVHNATIPLNVRIPQGLNEVFKDKALKRYAGETWLVIRNANLLWGKADFVRYLNLIDLPENHYEQVWLLCGIESSEGILRLK